MHDNEKKLMIFPTTWLHKLGQVYFMHWRQNHFLTSIVSKSGIKHPICQSLEHQSHTNCPWTLFAQHTLKANMDNNQGRVNLAIYIRKMTWCTNGPSMFDHLSLPTIIFENITPMHMQSDMFQNHIQHGWYGLLQVHVIPNLNLWTCD